MQAKQIRAVVLFLGIVLLSLPSCKEEIKNTFSNKQYEDFADSLSEALRRGDSSFIIKRINIEELQEIFLTKTGVGLLSVDMAKTILRRELHRLAEGLVYAADRQYLRKVNQFKDTLGYHFIFRTCIPEEGLNYIELVLGAGKKQPLIQDVILYNFGGSYVDILSETYAAVMVDQNAFLPGKEGLSWSTQGQLSYLNSVRGLLRNDQLEQAAFALQSIGKELRSTRNFMVCELQYAVLAGDSLLIERTLKQLNKRFPNHPELLLVQIDANFVAGHYKQMFSNTDLLEKRVKDPFLNLARGNAYARMDSIALAESYFQKALAGSDYLYRRNCYTCMLRMYIEKGNVPACIRIGNEIIENAVFDGEEVAAFFLEGGSISEEPEIQNWIRTNTGSEKN
jgi:hypothetical protein